jgi:hypothetical protein
MNGIQYDINFEILSLIFPFIVSVNNITTNNFMHRFFSFLKKICEYKIEQIFMAIEKYFSNDNLSVCGIIYFV